MIIVGRTLRITVVDSEDFVYSNLEFFIWSTHESAVTTVGKKRIQFNTCKSWLLDLENSAFLTFDYLLPLNEEIYTSLTNSTLFDFRTLLEANGFNEDQDCDAFDYTFSFSSADAGNY